MTQLLGKGGRLESEAWVSQSCVRDMLTLDLACTECWKEWVEGMKNTFPGAMLCPFEIYWTIILSLSPSCSTQKRDSCMGRCSAGGRRIYPWRVLLPSLPLYISKTAASNWQMEAENLKCPILHHSKPSPRRQINFMLCQLPYLFLFWRKRLKDYIVQLMFLFKME